MKKTKKILKIVERKYELFGPLTEKSSNGKNEYYAYTLHLGLEQEIGLDETTGKFYYRKLVPATIIWGNWKILKNYRASNIGKGLPDIHNTNVLTQKVQTVLMKGLNKKIRNPKKEPCKVGVIDPSEISFAISDLKKTLHYAESDFNIDVIQKRNNLKKSGANRNQMKEFETGVADAYAQKKWPASRRFHGGGN